MTLYGRGGYGNYKPSPKIAAKDCPDSPELVALKTVPTSQAPVLHYTSPNQTFTAGRGGAGNVRPISQLHTVTPQEYLQDLYDATHSEPAVYTVGRGGRGNFVASTHPNKAQEVVAAHHNDHTLTSIFSRRSQNERKNSGESSEDGIWHKLKVTLTR